MDAPVRLRVEHLDRALGIMKRDPRLSWQLPTGARQQYAYEIRIGDWTSGWIDSDRSLLVPYPGPRLSSRERVEWAVRVWTNLGESSWSEAGWWETGLLSPTDWNARWIEPTDCKSSIGDTSPAFFFRQQFVLDKSCARARVYATAHGVYELYLNGTRVGDMELTPGFTSYAHNLHVQTFDVTEMLVQGVNVIGAILGDGWFRGQVGGWRIENLFGDTVSLLVQLNVDFDDGSTRVIGSGPDWTWWSGAISEADLMQGEDVDFRKWDYNWCMPQTNTIWSQVKVCDYDLIRLKSSPASPVKRVEEVVPSYIHYLPRGKQVVDLGRNINGWIRLTNLGNRGTQLTLTYGEACSTEGEVTQENILVRTESLPLFREREFSNLDRPIQVDRVTSAGTDAGCFEPRHTIHGFRYVQIEGHDKALDINDLTGIVVHTDFRRVGWFACGDERINRLHDAAVWSFRGNACDIPTDCPTRERAGWTGDWQVFVESAAFIYDIAGFSEKWLTDLACEQRADGLVFDCVPNVYPEPLLKRTGTQHGSAGWGDAAVIVPWEIYRAYGDTDVLRRQWPSITAWISYAARIARHRRHPDRIAARPEAASHERFIWDTGFHYGEWLEPGDWKPTPANIVALARIDFGEVATAYLFRSVQLAAKIAKVLDKSKAVARYERLASLIRFAWQTEFMGDDGTLVYDTQASHVRALAFGLVPEHFRDRCVGRLVELIRNADTHLATGFLSTPLLLPVLADNGHLDIAYELLFQTTQPSWLAMLERGATTMWESWNGVDENANVSDSLNHYSKGAVISFLHQYLAGVRLIDQWPGYKRFRIQPCPGFGMDRAHVRHDSPYGRIESSWRIVSGLFALDVELPAGTTAEIWLPDGQHYEAGPGVAHYQCRID